MKKKCVLILMTCLFFLHVLVMAGYACVGRILTISVTDSPDQQVIAQILSVLITERTGTCIELIQAADVQASEKKMEKGDADIIISYLGVARAGIEGAESATNSQETYAIVKAHYLQNSGMVWLKPFGYSGPTGNEFTQKESIAAPITTTTVLDRFPVLDRVINKLDGKIDDAILKQLAEQSATGDPREVAKSFLKARNMI
ncbi:MAG: glycine betaine ABC transporter substrate-binding protein [Thermodesulfobacteriota bacterium]|nr:glycine betaine ABC transporter substrate-binding protein [Thermodesulfobacteriota bacterium]